MVWKFGFMDPCQAKIDNYHRAHPYPPLKQPEEDNDNTFDVVMSKSK